MQNDVLYVWDQTKMVEITLSDPEKFLVIKETLTRMGILSRKEAENGKRDLIQSCHILHKQGRYYIVHFKEMFLLDGKTANLFVSDIERRNLIASLLEQWGLCKLVNPTQISSKAQMSAIKIVPHKEITEYNFITKYRIGLRPTRHAKL